VFTDSVRVNLGGSRFRYADPDEQAPGSKAALCQWSRNWAVPSWIRTRSRTSSRSLKSFDTRKAHKQSRRREVIFTKLRKSTAGQRGRVVSRRVTPDALIVAAVLSMCDVNVPVDRKGRSTVATLHDGSLRRLL
jgi:hypothetical protein